MNYKLKKCKKINFYYFKNSTNEKAHRQKKKAQYRTTHPQQTSIKFFFEK